MRFAFSRFARTTGPSILALYAVVLASAGPVPTGKPAHYPDWWFERDVIPRLPAHANEPDPVWPDHYPSADDYAVANIGQLKMIANAAALEFAAKLPGGADPAIEALVSPWSLPPAAETTRNDYAAVNQGQLKTVVKPFYDKLINIGATESYPWAAAPGAPDDYSLVNLGQVKHLFSFYLSAANEPLPDWWQTLHFGNLGIDPEADPDGDGRTNLQEYASGTNPQDYYNGQPAVLSFVSGHQQASIPGEYYPDPVVVRVTRPDGTILVNAPLVFAVNGDEPGGGLAQTSGAPSPLQTLTVRTNSAGEAQVAWKVVAP